MKNRTLKNIFISIGITSFFVMIYVMVSGYLYNSIFEKALLSDVNDYIQSQNMEESIKEDFESFEGEDGAIMYETRVIQIFFNAKSSAYEEMLYGIIISVILGCVIGELKTVIESNLDKKAVTKRIILVFFIGLIVLEVILEFFDYLRYGYLDIENIIGIAMLYIIVFVCINATKLAIDARKQRKLNNLVKTCKDSKK